MPWSFVHIYVYLCAEIPDPLERSRVAIFHHDLSIGLSPHVHGNILAEAGVADTHDHAGAAAAQLAGQFWRRERVLYHGAGVRYRILT